MQIKLTISSLVNAWKIIIKIDIKNNKKCKKNYKIVVIIKNKNKHLHYWAKF